MSSSAPAGAVLRSPIGGPPGRFVEGFERVLVGLQTALFLLTVKRRFGRN
jgi:hypothetical protein